MKARPAGFAVLAAAVAMVGCGGSNDSAPKGDLTKIGAVVDKLQKGAQDGDGAAMCDLFTQTLRQRVEDQSGKKCADGVKESLADNYSALTVRSLDIQPGVSRAGAAVVEKNGSAARIFFLKQGDQWLIDVIRRPGIGTPIS